MNIYSYATNLFGKYVNVESRIFRKLKDNLKKAIFENYILKIVLLA